MFVEKTLGFFRGYVVICAEGLFCERFMNICMRRDIYLWNIRRMGDQRIVACISIGGFKELREIARKTRTRISIVKRCGMPFVLHRYRKRKVAVLGLVVFVALLWYLTTHIMGIDVTGNTRISTAEIVKGLESCGVYHGAAVGKIDDKTVQNQMMVKFDEIAWIGINIKGSRVYVDVRERLDTKVRLGADTPCDIVAARDGIIRLLDVKDGQTMVKLNQLVEKGDLLVSGVVDSQSMGMRYVHSFGEIHADTTYKKTRDYTFDYVQKNYTGETKKRYKISVMGKALKLYFKAEQPFENCDSVTETKEYRTPVPQIPSLFVECESFREYMPEKRTRTLEETVKIATADLCAALDKEISASAQITDKKITHTALGKNGVRVTVEYLCREDIGSQRIIDKTELLGYDNIEEK